MTQKTIKIHVLSERENVLYVTTFKYSLSLMSSISTTMAEFRVLSSIWVTAAASEGASVLPVFHFLPPKSTRYATGEEEVFAHVAFHVNGFRMLKC